MIDQLDSLPLSSSQLYWLRDNWPDDDALCLKCKPSPQRDGPPKWSVTLYRNEVDGSRTHLYGFWTAPEGDHFFEVFRFLVIEARRDRRLSPASQWLD